MLEWLVHIDTQLFFLINKTLANPVFDVIMPFITNDKYFRIPIFVIWLGLIWKGGRRGRIVAFLILFTILLSDQLSSSIVKPLVGRIRPCNALEGVRLLMPCSGSFSFTSSHATNIFAAARVFAAFYPAARWYFYGYAAMIAYSRPYVGVHYPFDVIGGAVLGLLAGTVILLLHRHLLFRYFPNIFNPKPTEQVVEHE